MSLFSVHTEGLRGKNVKSISRRGAITDIRPQLQAPLSELSRQANLDSLH